MVALCVLLGCLLAGFPLTASAAGDSGPPLTVPEEALAAALQCPPDLASPRDPVLLVHGTAADSRKWSAGYGALLPRLGHAVCTVDLPDKATGDIQVATEYVVYGIRSIAAASGRRVAVIGHSQGSLEIRWATRWWPDTRKLISDAVSLAGANHGTEIADQFCALPVCSPALWQMMRTPSAFLGALNAGDETPNGPAWTSVYSRNSQSPSGAPADNDGAVVPAGSSRLAGAVNFAVQDLCPGRPVDHNRLLFDAVAFAATVDALRHAGPARPARLNSALCHDDLASGVDPDAMQQSENESTVVFGTALVLGPHATSEPPLAPYTQG